MKKILVLIALTASLLAEPYLIGGVSYANSESVDVKCRANGTVGIGYTLSPIIAIEYRGRYGLSSDYYSHELLLKPTYEMEFANAYLLGGYGRPTYTLPDEHFDGFRLGGGAELKGKHNLMPFLDFMRTCNEGDYVTTLGIRFEF